MKPVIPPDHGTPIDPGGHRPRETHLDIYVGAPTGIRTPGVAPPGRTRGPVYDTSVSKPGATARPLPAPPPNYLVDRAKADRIIAKRKEKQRVENRKKFRPPFA